VKSFVAASSVAQARFWAGMKVIVTGGTGFVGSAIADRLTAEGHSVGIVSRRRPANPSFQHLGPLAALSAEPERLRGFGAVIHLVGIISEPDKNAFEEIHVEGTRIAVEAARASGIKRFIHMSALGTRPNASSRYHQTKWAGEELVRNSGLEWTLFRPSLIYGSGDQFINLFEKISRWSPFVPIIGGGASLVQPIEVGAVARCFAGALSRPETAGRTFDLCGRERLSFRELIRCVLRLLNRKRLVLPIPVPVARFQAQCMEWAYSRLFHRAPPLNRDQIIMLAEDNIGDPDPACERFGIRLAPFEDGIKMFLTPTAGEKSGKTR
jgi:NADH dehydrogenase